MHLSSRVRILAFALAPVLAVAAMACAGGGDGQQAVPFRVGVLESLTGPGETYGTVAERAKQMAADEINAAGGINGRSLELVVEDSKCSAQDAITAYNKLTDVDGMKIILGTSCSGACLAWPRWRRRMGGSCSPDWRATRTSPTPATTSSGRRLAIFRWASAQGTFCGRTGSAIWPPSRRPPTTPRV